jgi:hypothetical protein
MTPVNVPLDVEVELPPAPVKPKAEKAAKAVKVEQIRR